MKHRIVFAVVFSVLMGLIAAIGPGSAEAARMYGADTGMITLGQNQFLRMTIANTSQRRRNNTLNVSFRGQVTGATCTNGVCTHTVTSQTVTSPVALTPGQAASYDIIPTPGASAIRGIVIGDDGDAQVNVLIIDANTGETAGAVAGVLYAVFHTDPY